MNTRLRTAVALLAVGASAAFGLPNLDGIALSESSDSYKTASDVVDDTPLGTLEADFDTTRELAMSPLAALELGPTTDVQLQRRTGKVLIDGERVQGPVDIAAVGLSDLGDSFHGLAMVDVTDPANPVELSRIECGEFHNDVAIWRRYVVIGFDGGAGPCPLAGDEVLETAGVYVFDAADPANLEFVAAFDGIADDVLGDLTTGTHNLAIHPDGILYFATAGFDATEPDLGIVDLSVLFEGGELEQVMVPMRDISPLAVDGCHDMGFAFDLQEERPDMMVCPAIGLTHVWDISDPFAPVELSTIANPGINIHHGGRFSPDGTSVLLGDELAGAGAPSGCVAGGPIGAIWAYDVTEPLLPLLTGYVSAAESPGTIETCTSHFYNFVPRNDGDTQLMTGWYGGGMVSHDVTGILGVGATGGAGPEIAHLEPTDAEMWNAYAWYGHVYGGSYTGNTGLFIATLDGYTDTERADLAPYCNDVGIVWGPWGSGDWRKQCRGDDVAS